ncbi:MAG: glycoside hydrolase family 3 N-terminal domain-containing protein [Buchananella hordeovulneris]|nr:glycoside hydrolase family 3 N-terminal domain-containing protein [Buchananella hordeovulneris]
MGRRLASLGIVCLGLAAACTTAPPLRAPAAATTPPTATAPPAATASGPPSPRTPAVEHLLTRRRVRDKIGQIIWPYAYGASADDTSRAADNQAVFGPEVHSPAEAVVTHRLGGLLYFTWTDNLSTPLDPAQVAELSADLQASAARSGLVPLALAVDQEGGPVSRLGAPATLLPPALAVGAANQPELSRRVGGVLGQELAALGINVDFAPAVDLNTNPANPIIGVRALGDDPQRVGPLAAAQIEGLQAAGVAATAKHFPGHGDTAVDSHLGLPIVTYDEATLQTHLAPFRTAIAADVDLIMSAHIIVQARDPQRPATLSPALLTDLLRDDLGYTGLITTDALDMEGVRLAVLEPGEAEAYAQADPDLHATVTGRVCVQALQAGADVLLSVPDVPAAVSAIEAALADGSLPSARLDDAARRVLTWKAKRGLLAPPQVEAAAAADQLGQAQHQQVAREVAGAAVTVVRAGAPLPLSVQSTPRLALVGPPEAAPEFFAQALRQAGFAVETITSADLVPTAGERARMVALAERVDVVLALTADADDAQLQFVHQLAALATPLVVVATATPYELAHWQQEADAPALLATFSTAPGADSALVAALTSGKAPGSLPVRLSLPATEK